jgi:hypothetical protein
MSSWIVTVLHLKLSCQTRLGLHKKQAASIMTPAMSNKDKYFATVGFLNTSIKSGM